MMARRILWVVAVAVLLTASPASAQWYKDYEDGLKAARAENWNEVVEKMNAAIKAKPKEGTRERTYGTIMIPYHPYYYRGVAYLNLGKLDEAVRDLSRATGVGSVDLGAVATKVMQAQMQLQQQQAPPPVTQTTPPTTTVAQAPPVTQTTAPPPTETRGPQIDPNLAPARERARTLLTQARSKLEEATRVDADGLAPAEFTRAQSLLLDAERQAVNADKTSDWNLVAASADDATKRFNLAITSARIARTQQQRTPISTSAAEDAVAVLKSQVRDALDAYFKGDFSSSVTAFQDLTRKQQENPMLWAFLGAAHYYKWYLNGQVDEGEKQAAITAFRNARRFDRNFRLNERYFSPRVRSFYDAELR